MPKGAKGQKSPADVIGNAIRVAKIVTGDERRGLPCRRQQGQTLPRSGCPCRLSFHSRARPASCAMPDVRVGTREGSGKLAAPAGGRPLMVREEPSKLKTRVRFPPPAPASAATISTAGGDACVAGGHIFQESDSPSRLTECVPIRSSTCATMYRTPQERPQVTRARHSVCGQNRIAAYRRWSNSGKKTRCAVYGVRSSRAALVGQSHGAATFPAT